MVALRGKEIDAFLARPDPSRPIILLYGPDTGLVRERADAILSALADWAEHLGVAMVVVWLQTDKPHQQ